MLTKPGAGKGILDHCYASLRTIHYSNKYDFAITEIAATNLRSLKAHRRIGFKEINTYLINRTKQNGLLCFGIEIAKHFNLNSVINFAK